MNFIKKYEFRLEKDNNLIITSIKNKKDIIINLLKIIFNKNDSIDNDSIDNNIIEYFKKNSIYMFNIYNTSHDFKKKINGLLKSSALSKRVTPISSEKT